MTDTRVEKLAQILVDHSTWVGANDRILIEATTAAEPLVRALYIKILERGGYPHLLLNFPDEDEVFFAHAENSQLDFTPTFTMLAYETFEGRIRIKSETNTRALSQVKPSRQARRSKALEPILKTQMQRGADESFRWVTTIYPTEAYAMEAEMGLQEYADYVYCACHTDENTPDPLAYWLGVKKEQERIIHLFEGKDQVVLRGPTVDLKLSIKGRTFKNACGINNMPDGEIYTGPVENSVNGWVHFTYPAIYHGRIVEGIELTFENGKVVKAKAQKNEELLLELLKSDEGAKYVGEFAIGTNFEITRITKQILLDEKIGGSFHMALGRGYPETGSQNKSAIHWDMICDLRKESEISVDGDVVYRNGEFVG
ncbi:MAG: aminopeptidase [Chloroflexota bacterium]